MCLSISIIPSLHQAHRYVAMWSVPGRMRRIVGILPWWGDGKKELFQARLPLITAHLRLNRRQAHSVLLNSPVLQEWNRNSSDFIPGVLPDHVTRPSSCCKPVLAATCCESAPRRIGITGSVIISLSSGFWDGPLTSRLHAALEDDDLVIFGAWGHRRQASDVRIGRHVLQMMRGPYGFGQTLPALGIKKRNK